MLFLGLSLLRTGYKKNQASSSCAVSGGVTIVFCTPLICHTSSTVPASPIPLTPLVVCFRHQHQLRGGLCCKRAPSRNAVADTDIDCTRVAPARTRGISNRPVTEATGKANKTGLEGCEHSFRLQPAFCFVGWARSRCPVSANRNCIDKPEADNQQEEAKGKLQCAA